jgi:hypothetical protein
VILGTEKRFRLILGIPGLPNLNYQQEKQEVPFIDEENHIVYITVYAYFSGQISSETCRNLVSCKGYITPSHYLIDLFPYKNLQYIS